MSDPIIYASAEDCEAAFYDAFERADIEAMMALWADDEEVVCVHPNGQRLTGFGQVRAGWLAIFSSGQHYTVRIAHRLRWQSGLLAVHNVFETLQVSGGGQEGVAAAVTTNVFSRGARGWRLVAHHAAPCNEAVEMEQDLPRILH